MADTAEQHSIDLENRDPNSVNLHLKVGDKPLSPVAVAIAVFFLFND